MLLAIVALGASFTACGGANSPSGNDDGGAEHFTPVVPDQSAVQALEDGVISRAEYLTAITNTLACLDEEGVAHTELIYDESQATRPQSLAEGESNRIVHRGPTGAQYTYRLTSPLGEHQETGILFAECWMRYERGVTWVGPEQGAKEVTNEQDALACARRLGLRVESVDELGALWNLGLREIMPQTRTCLDIAMLKSK